MGARNGVCSAICMTLALTLAGLPALALTLASVAQAAPPQAGDTYTFEDPVFNGTVVCDTLEQVADIATAEAPNDVYGFYRIMANELNEPTCMAIVPTGIVLDVVPLGVMEKEGDRYDAWAVQTELGGGAVVYALYLELIRGLQV